MKSNLLFLLLLLNNATIFCQDTLTYQEQGPDKNVFYHFERTRNDHSKKIKQGRSLTVYLEAGDTARSYFGNLVGINEQELLLATTYESRNYYSDGYSLDESMEYEETKYKSIPVSTIKSLEYSPGYSGYANLLTALSSISALIVAPLVAIDKNAPNHFNTPLYKDLLLISAIGVGTGITFYIILEGGSQRFSLKPKLR